MSKKILINSYTSAGVFVKAITDASFTGFTKSINGGLGPLTLKLARQIDSYNTDLDVSIGNRIEINIYDEDALAGVKIYVGWIETQNLFINGGEEYVEILCLGLFTKLSNDILRSTTDVTLCTKTATYLGVGTTATAIVESSNLFKTIIDYFNTNNTLFPINYDNNGVSTIENNGNPINCVFKLSTYFDAIEKCREVAPQNWYWFLGADGKMIFKAPLGTSTHNFILRKNIRSLKITKTIQPTKNILMLKVNNTGTTSLTSFRKYENVASSTTYGRRVKYQEDNRFSDEATMDVYANSYLNENKDIFYNLELDIYDSNDNPNGYDIESINPGDTCQISNILNNDDVVGVNMVISEVQWTMDFARITVGVNKLDFDKYIIGLNKSIELKEKEVGGGSYYNVSGVN